MNDNIKNRKYVKKLLWADTLLGGITAILGLCFFNSLKAILGLPIGVIVGVSIITLLYSIVALVLANQQHISISLLRILVFANWFWTIISIGLLLMYFNSTALPGRIFLILQVVIVGGLAYLEGRQVIVKTKVVAQENDR